MGLQLPKRSGAPVKRVGAAALGASSLMLLLSGCGGDAWTRDQWSNFGLPDPITEQGPYTFELWKWAWVAALIVGVIVWGLIFWVAWAYRRRHADEVPVQTRYNLPLEVFYTIAPILMVVVFFYQTVRVQDVLTNIDPEPDVTVEVMGQQWSWTFNHGIGEQNTDADPENGDFAYDQYAYTSGTASEIPTLVLPVDQTVHFNLYSPDVIHDFGVPSFLMKMDVIPGRVNQFQVTPTVEGTFAGKCYELCGTYHSRMLFKVKIVSQQEYADYVAGLEESGAVSDEPLLGGSDVTTQTGLDESQYQEGSEE